MKFRIDYFKNKTPDFGYLEDIVPVPSLSESSNEVNTAEYVPYNIKNIQNYYPLYKEFFELNTSNMKTVALNHLYHIVDLKTVKHRITGDTVEVPIFTKFAPLLDPIHYMIGKYTAYEGKTTVLPQYDMPTETCIPKIQSIHNASYIDNFFYYLTSQMRHTHDFIHGLDYYGAFLGVQDKYRIDVVDDIEYLNDSSFFKKNRGTLFEIENHYDPFSNFGSRGNKDRLQIGGDEDCLIEFDSFECEGGEQEQKQEEESPVDKSSVDKSPKENILCDNIDEIYKLNSSSSSSSSSSSHSCSCSSSSHSCSSSSSSSSLNDSSEEDDDENSSEEDDSEENSSENSEDENSNNTESEDPVIYAYIKDFPVQLICLEKCDDTFDSLLLKGELEEKEYAAILFQVIMILATYQKCFRFTHNDLHTNNIMFSKTSAKYIDYIFNGVSYSVPTYGRIFKIIDFGRAIYTFSGKIFGSDSFNQGGDAHTQYNCEPFSTRRRNASTPILVSTYVAWVVQSTISF